MRLRNNHGRLSSAAIALDHLTREFRSGRRVVRALDELTLEVPDGQPVALLGVNGAGKTTLSKILSTWIYPTSGAVRVFGFDVIGQPRAASRSVVPIFGGDRGLYPMLTGRENLRYFSAVRGRRARLTDRRISESLEEVGLDHAQDRRVEEYSRGMMQRLHLAVGLACDAPLVVMDEPTVGLDPVEAARFRGTIRDLVDRGRTLLLTSPNLADVEEVADRVLFLDAGKLRYDLPLANFKELAGYKYRLLATTRRALTKEGFECARNAYGTYTVQRLLTTDQVADISSMLAAIGDAEILDFTLREPTLDEAFSAAARRA